MLLIKNYKYIISIILIMLIMMAIIIVKHNLNQNKYDLIIENDQEIINNEESEIIDNAMCTVDIKGAINKPGIYTIACNKYVNDVIKLAEGLMENADTSTINLAKKIADEMVIIIYTKEEINNNLIKSIDNECVCPIIKNDAYVTNETSSKLININKATIDELETLPGIGIAKAKTIVEYRNNFGNFKSIEDIKNVSGIGEKLYEKIKAFITT